ncbi:hypothetical protein HHX47_DHR5000603 [Lentinula edodes]|nr:hypothetical protein HHX47_DHR5000603 [Lentinula edodes]
MMTRTSEMFQSLSQGLDVEKRPSNLSEPYNSPPHTPSSPDCSGVTYQGELGARPKRQHFFSALDSNYAEAVNLDAETVVYTLEEDTLIVILALFVRSNLFPKCCAHRDDIPIVNQFDRTNIGNAHIIPAFNENFVSHAASSAAAVRRTDKKSFKGITDNNKWTLALSIFYVGYCLLEIPANVLQRHIGANRFFFLSLTFWGIGEAGFYAGVIYYLSFWYKRHELAMRISLCMTATYSGAIGGLLAFGLVRAHTPLLDGFFTPREKAIAQARVNRDHRPQSHGGMTGWQGFKAVVIDPNAWMFMSIYASFNVGVATISYFLPTLINDLGFTAINAQGLTVAPYVLGWGMVVLQAWHSDKTRERGASPQIYFDPEDDYVKGHAISAGCLFLSMLMAFALRTRLSWLNKRNAQRLSGMSEDEKALLPAVNEMDDQDPRYVFMI